MKKFAFLLVCVIFILSLTSCRQNLSHKAVRAYDVSTLGNNFGGGDAYKIGANQYGKPIFIDKDKAFQQALIDYANGFEAIQVEYKLSKIRKSNWKLYGVYGWQLTKADEKAQKEGLAITQFFDVYENSFA